jgi:hypothetical protein
VQPAPKLKPIAFFVKLSKHVQPPGFYLSSLKIAFQEGPIECPPSGGFFMTTKPARSKVAHHALGSDGGHVFVGLMDALSAFEPQREGNRGSEVARIGGRELVVGIGHERTIARH